MLSRREFLRSSIWYALALAGGSALAGCERVPQAALLNPTAPATATTVLSPATLVAVATPIAVSTPVPVMTATPTLPAAGQTYLSVARGADPAAITRAAIDALGGITRFVKPGNDVIVKPNICNAQNGPEYASTTNPQVVAEIVKLCLAAGAKRVRVMDQPFSGIAVEAYKTSGIRAAVEQAGGQMELMASNKYIPLDFPHGRSLKTAAVYQDILKADVVINVPIAKHHGSAKLTIAMKALMGVVQDRGAIHLALDQRIADLNTAIKPTLIVVDAVRVLMNHGPTGGNLKDVKPANTLIATCDPVAADAYAAQVLFDRSPEEIGYIRMGAEMGLGRYDFGNLRIQEIKV